MIRGPMLLMTALMMLAAGCSNPPTGDGLPTTKMTIGKRTYTLEIAADPIRRQIGLMRRDSMPANRGMLFIFADDQPRSFWMKDTRIPLDILFLDRDGQVVSIGQMQPHTGRAESGQPARYAIELNAGQVDHSGIKPGDRITLPDDVLQMQVDE